MNEDSRFCLIDANGTEMPVALVKDEYRFGKSKHEPAPTIEAFASGIIKHSKTGRFGTPRGRNTIGLNSKGVIGYTLDQEIAKRISVPARHTLGSGPNNRIPNLLGI